VVNASDLGLLGQGRGASPVHVLRYVLSPIQMPCEAVRCGLLHRRCDVAVDVHRRGDRGVVRVVLNDLREFPSSSSKVACMCRRPLRVTRGSSSSSACARCTPEVQRRLTRWANKSRPRWGDLSFTTGRLGIRRAADVTTRNQAKTTKTGSARVLDLDTDTLAVLKTYKAKRGAISLPFARADAYTFGNDGSKARWQFGPAYRRDSSYRSHR
jgi:hypothetical protein